jgi:four helix bundle suffix protein
MSTPEHLLIPPHGGYRKLRAFQVAELVYDATLVFCDRFVRKDSRTHDQMVQAARSGRQNIAEGSVGSATSKKGELKLTNIARASLEELRLDYEDFLRQRGLRQWEKDSPEALAVRGRYRQEGSDGSVLADVRTASAEVAANTMLCLINQASYLLRRQIERLERDFLEQGGFTERLYGARKRSLEERKAGESGKSDRSDEEASPRCPRCGRPMQRRTARQGPKAGQPFWGCTGYPECRGIRPV